MTCDKCDVQMVITIELDAGVAARAAVWAAQEDEFCKMCAQGHNYMKMEKQHVL